MRLNHKQEELIAQLAEDIEKRFPEVKFVEAVPSPEGENALLLRFTEPEDDDRFMDILEYAGERTTDLLLDYGYHLVVAPVVKNGAHAARL
ncbi:hypothetical protein DWB58_27300 [candidate division KSB1 bacterium]|nr:hypothetical protein [candidate division KSB1 bacterium]